MIPSRIPSNRHGPAFFGNYVLLADEYSDRWLFDVRSFVHPDSPALRVLVWKGHPETMVLLRPMTSWKVHVLAAGHKEAVRAALQAWSGPADAVLSRT